MKRKSDRQEGLPLANRQNSGQGLRVLQHAKPFNQTSFPREKAKPLRLGKSIAELLDNLVISANHRPLSSAENQIAESTSIRPNDPNLEGMPTELIQLVLDRLVDNRISSGEVRELFEDFESLSRVSSKIKAAVAGSPAAKKAELHYYALHFYEDLSKFAETYKTHRKIYDDALAERLESLDRRLDSGELSEEQYHREADRPAMSEDSAMDQHEEWCEEFSRKFRRVLPYVEYLEDEQQETVASYFECTDLGPRSAPLLLDTLKCADSFCSGARDELDYLAILLVQKHKNAHFVAFDQITKSYSAGRLRQRHLDAIARLNPDDFPDFKDELHAIGVPLSAAARSGGRSGLFEGRRDSVSSRDSA